jgi:hypothetical protein
MISVDCDEQKMGLDQILDGISMKTMMLDGIS